MNSKLTSKVKWLAITILVLGTIFSGTTLNRSSAISPKALGANKQPTPLSQETERISSQEGMAVEAVRVPQECLHLKPRVQTRGIPNNFGGPPKPTFPSPALIAFMSGHPTLKYDQPGPNNSYFGDSFELGNCKICFATLEIRVRQISGDATNDLIYAGGAPFAGASRVLGVALYPPPSGITRTYVLTPALNNYIFSPPFGPKMLDVFLQDDSAVDYIKLTYW